MALTPVLTIAGSDPTGGAGLQADLQTFRDLGCHGLGVLTAITVQSTVGVEVSHPLPAEWVRGQLECLLADVAPLAAKTGMLATDTIVREVARTMVSCPNVPLVVDPVLRAGSGAVLLDESGVEALRRELLPLAALVTPNLAEAEALTGLGAANAGEMAACAGELVALGARAALVTGGHLVGDAVDVLCSEGRTWELRADRIPGGPVHGTGCALSAAAAAFLARGASVTESVRRARGFVRARIAAAQPLGRGALILGPGEGWQARAE
jgi:hydroxymethylpyrimidine kinase/phosphomethylpyrimidine kinase